MSEGSCRLGLWFVNVTWTGNIVHRIRFHKTGIPGPVPEPITRYLAGKVTTLEPLVCQFPTEDTAYNRIYQAVQTIPYGSVRTYGEIARQTDTSARVVGMAMKRNVTPIIIPCHRVVASNGIGGFTPDPWIKQELLRIEAETSKKFGKLKNYFQDLE